MESLELAKKIAAILDAKKATDIRVIEIKGVSGLGDYFVLASGSNTTLTKALSDELEEKLAEIGIQAKRIEGYQSATWILLDYYDVIVHIFYSETRQFYSLERLWADCRQVDISDVIKEN
ncbi:MAG: ribosome silencing factor [Oscillospiraceae bacterium]|nr:ribosome silencing factor [Oscillospiraceae bacterium]